ncbi:hypothetical protein ADK67_40290 [Saccharothrix sp. NRRL B-16348]|uniref:DNA primase family protein n=1 Tax=Saccharothrix sp. NRRL B-16348 TaxID=1415542 RepID=UPI0006AE8568|nr:phage/plasmid primase, P4 family [Saccharothrix sp. NRRL B-16348]KOX16195.1 hypothetical protein ADK67_40290 [Saccharothrix sp. NRRL B-16348]
MTALIDMFPDAFDDDAELPPIAPVPTQRPAVPTSSEVPAAPVVVIPAAVDPLDTTCRHDSAVLPDPLPDTVLAALGEALPPQVDKWQGVARVVTRCRVAGLTVHQACAVVRMLAPATAHVHRKWRAIICQIVRGPWDDADPFAQSRTDNGNAVRFGLEHSADLAWSPEAGGWFVWDGSRWAADDGTAVQGLARSLAARMLREAHALASAKGMSEDEQKLAKARVSWATQTNNLGHVRAMCDFVRNEPGVKVPGTAWDARPELLAVGNGVVELRHDGGAHLRAPSRLDRLTRTTATPYTPGKSGPLWTAFLERAVPDPDVRRYLQKLAGYSLFGGNAERLLVLLIGPTSTGKTTFLEIIAGALGEHAAPFSLSMFRAKRDESPRPDLLDAMPRRLLFSSEASDRWSLHSDEVKRLVGADSLAARALHSSKIVTGRPSFVPWIGSNAAPSVLDADQALFRRLVVVPFTVTTPKDQEDPTLGARVREHEAAAVLAWLGTGWDMYAAEGLGDLPPVCAEAALQLRSDLSALDKWISEECELDAEYSAPVDLLWRAYLAWSMDARIDQAERGNKIRFGRDLTGRGFGVGKAGDKNNRIRVRTGVRLTAEAMQRLTHATEAAEHGGGFSIGD